MEKFLKVKSYLKSILGTSYYENEKCILFKGNCLELMQKIDKSFINTIITSPPYNIGKEYEQKKSIDEYIAWSKEWMYYANKLLENEGNFLLNIGYLQVENKGRAVPLAYLLWDKIDLFLNQEIVWNYSAGVACKKYLSPRNEKILWYVKDKNNYTFNLDPIRDKNVKYPNSKKNGRLRVNSLGKNPSDVWEIAKVTSGMNRSSTERTPHPAQFPLDLINKLVLGFSNKEDIILDPFLGSGTTFESCIKNNRYCIGFEIKEDYCNLIKQRITLYK